MVGPAHSSAVAAALAVLCAAALFARGELARSNRVCVCHIRACVQFWLCCLPASACVNKRGRMIMRTSLMPYDYTCARPTISLLLPMQPLSCTIFFINSMESFLFVLPRKCTSTSASQHSAEFMNTNQKTMNLFLRLSAVVCDVFAV